jgi:hypothetical protein
MRTPGFTADKSSYDTTNCYRVIGSVVQGGKVIHPSLEVPPGTDPDCYRKCFHDCELRCDCHDHPGDIG